jgi:transposase
MPGSYSLDLRQRVIAACDEGRLSRREIAELYEVGESTIYVWLKLRRDTSKLVAKPHTGGRRSELNPAVLDELVEAENDGPWPSTPPPMPRGRAGTTASRISAAG